MPNIIDLSKEMSRDHKALDLLNFVTALYKIKEVHGVVNHKRLVNDLMQSIFSMNIDECFSNNNMKVLSILVSYFSETAHLSDSTNHMSGKVGVFETLLRQVVPHLLEIDGDICHHVHNSVQKFCKQRRVEGLDDDLHTDMKWSPHLRGSGT